MSRALRARGATRLLARRLDLDTLDNDERDHSTSASACHHVQWMDARNVESKVRAACPKAEGLMALRCCSAEEDEATLCFLEALLARRDT